MAFFDYFVAEDAYLALGKIQGGLSQGSVTGKTYWVDHSHADANNEPGRGTFSAPFDTIDYAIGVTTASAGDVILVMPGHTETISADAAIALDVISTSIVGLGHGSNRAKVTFNNTAATIEVTVAGCRIQNLRFETGIAAVATFINLASGSTGCAILGNQFIAGDPGYYPVRCITFAVATIRDVEISRNRFCFTETSGTDSTDGIYAPGGGGITDRLVVADNYIAGSFTASAIDVASTSYDSLIVRNQVYNSYNSVAAGAIKTSGTVTGSVVADNRGYNKHATALTGTGADANCENYFTDDLTVSGILDPAIV